MAQTIYATFSDPANAEKAAGALLDYGVQADDISIVSNENYRFGHTGHPAFRSSDSGCLGGETRGGGAIIERPIAGTTYGETFSGAVPSPDFTTVDPIASESFTDSESTYRDTTERVDNTEHAAKTGLSTTTPGDAASGAAKGAGLGLGVGVIAGLAALAVPGVGTLVGSGLLAQAIGISIAGAVGATAAGAVAGGVTGYLKDQGVDDNTARTYSDTIAGGGSLLAVTLPSNNVSVAIGQSVLDKYGASNIANY